MAPGSVPPLADPAPDPGADGAGTAPDEATLRLMAVLSERLRCRLDRELLPQGVSEADHTVLAALAAPEASGCRPSDLAAAIGWDRSRLSHQLQRLERRALVVRVRGGAPDRRRSSVRLTPQGGEALRAAATRRDAVLRGLLRRPFADLDHDALDDALRRLVRSLGPCGSSNEEEQP